MFATSHWVQIYRMARSYLAYLSVTFEFWYRQDNPLYDVFTVRQHLMFFASLRGVSEQVQETRVMEVLRALGASPRSRGAWEMLGYSRHGHFGGTHGGKAADFGAFLFSQWFWSLRKLMRGCLVPNHSRHIWFQTGGVESYTEIKAYQGHMFLLWPKHHFYPLVIQHSYGTWPIYRWFLYDLTMITY